MTERAVQLGIAHSLPVDVQKRIRLCNILALGASAIMALWALAEALLGDLTNLHWEVGFLACFLAVLGLHAARAHRSARLLFVATANACVFVGALMFVVGSGGLLPFFALAALPLMVFGSAERRLLVLGTALPLLLFALCATGAAGRWLSIVPKPAPSWYFIANAASAFAMGFLIPFFFYRSNLKAEALLERMGQEKLHRFIDSNLIGVVRGRLSGHIEEANDAFLGLLGYNRRDLAEGMLDLKALAPLDPFDEGGGHALPQQLRRGARSVYERTLVGKNGCAVPTLVGMAPLDESHDEVVGFVLDLSAQKHVEAQKAMLRESEEALRLRDLFSSIASHELKTPLTALMLSLQILGRRLNKESPNGSTLTVQVERCQSSAARMGELIHTLLDVAQVHDGKLKLALHEVDVVEAVRRIASGFEANRTGSSRQIRVQAEGTVTAALDSLRFDQVVTNLLSNAIKYGGGKPIEVRVARDPAADAAHLEVIDHGLGIEPAMAGKIFEPFQRAVSADETIPGLGLGLYVVKMIVEGHGGRINVQSRPGDGSRFILDLPCCASASANRHAV